MKFHQFKIRFVENKKIFFGISIAVLLIGVIFNVIFGARLDIQFTGGAIVNYSFTGEINTDELAALVEETTGKASMSMRAPTLWLVRMARLTITYLSSLPARRLVPGGPKGYGGRDSGKISG